jgi:hypothetical protein
MKRILSITILITFSFVLHAVAKDWKENRSRHFVIYYKSAPQEFIKSVEESAEDYYYSIVDDLGFSRDQLWTWDDRAKIYIYDNEEDYVTSSRQAAWSSGSTQIGSRVIQTYPSAHGFFDSLLPHELGHIVFREYIGSSSDIPLWMDEGIAMYQEKAKRWGADEEVKKAMAEECFIPLQDLTQMRLTTASDRETVNLFYAESASVVHYLISEHGTFKFSLFCQNLKKGLRFEEALGNAYYRFKTIEDLNKAWVGYLKK